MSPEILWQPTDEQITESYMYRFRERIREKYGWDGDSYRELHQWSVWNIPSFWAEVWDFCGIRYSEDYRRVLDDPLKMPGARWFEGTRMNFAENLLWRRDDHPAIIFRCEDRKERTVTFADLFDEVRKLAAGLRCLGVQPGDRVAGIIPNMPEAVIAMLATASIGAIWSSSSPDLGVHGIVDRLKQTEPRVIFAADGYYYKGVAFDVQGKIRKILGEISCIEYAIMLDFTGKLNMRSIPNALSWDNVAQPSDRDLAFEQLPFSHPLCILYSSGTTGLPKSIVHSAGGTLLQHVKEQKLHCNIHPDDPIFFYTTCGWMMWNWLVSGLASGATLVLFDGNPFYPSPEILLRMADELQIRFFGTSARYIGSLEATGVKPSGISGFPGLRVIASTGSPLPAESFDFVYRSWKKDVQLSSISGGTDIISCFVLGNPILPVFRGEIQCIGLGMDVDCFDDTGKPAKNRTGEMVCKSPFPSMPVHFWNDPDGEKYRQAYFHDYPGIWKHGDHIRITPHGGVVIYGRSDATLNPGGVRIGTAEIYNVLGTFEEIIDSVAVGQRVANDESVVLFVKLTPGVKLDDDLTDRIRRHIRMDCSPRHVPSEIFEVPDIPYTVNGKKVEVAIKEIIHGREPHNREALSNPESLEYFRNRFD
ncbi:MAG: acetoacetate--CoA ligase [Bacteroidales bacterium]|nr:acetoacetate--CoA ligase [Bacteroidales bacterium]